MGPATTGAPQTHTASFTDLDADRRYVGEVRYDDGTAMVGRTIFTVPTP